MNDQPLEDPRSLEALEVCRPGSNDLAEPGLAFLAAEMAGNRALRERHDRLQRLDAKVSDAFGDVPIPDGLAGRIMEQLEAARYEPAAADQESSLPQAPPASAVAEVAKPRARISRRWLLAGAGSLVAAAAVLVAVIANIQPPVHDESVILDLAMDYFGGDGIRRVQGELVADMPPPDDYPISPGVLQSGETRWRRISDFLDCRGVAYDLAPRGGARATLYVVKYPAAGLPAVAPLRPFTTRNRSTAAWKKGSLLYVLVVEGGPKRYRSFLNYPRGPLT